MLKPLKEVLVVIKHVKTDKMDVKTHKMDAKTHQLEVLTHLWTLNYNKMKLTFKLNMKTHHK